MIHNAALALQHSIFLAFIIALIISLLLQYTFMNNIKLGIYIRIAYTAACRCRYCVSGGDCGLRWNAEEQLELRNSRQSFANCFRSAS